MFGTGKATELFPDYYLSEKLILLTYGLSLNDFEKLGTLGTFCQQKSCTMNEPVPVNRKIVAAGIDEQVWFTFFFGLLLVSIVAALVFWSYVIRLLESRVVMSQYHSGLCLQD